MLLFDHAMIGTRQEVWLCFGVLRKQVAMETGTERVPVLSGS